MLDAGQGADHARALQALYAVATRRSVGARQVLITEAEVPETLFLLSAGTATVALPDWHGQNVVLSLLGPGDFFGEMGMFNGAKGTRSAQVETRTECVILEIPYTGFIALCREHPLLWLELAGQLADRLRRTNRRLVGVRVLKLHERISYVLGELAATSDAQPISGGRRIRVTRDELGMLTGCTRETVGRALSEMAAEGRICLEGRHIVVLDAPPPLD